MEVLFLANLFFLITFYGYGFQNPRAKALCVAIGIFPRGEDQLSPATEHSERSDSPKRYTGAIL